MDSTRKSRLERTRTPVHFNNSVYQFKNSASKRFSPNLSRRPNLSETVNCGTGPVSDPKIKSKFSTPYAINYETECDIAYNDYLQALFRNQLVKKEIHAHKEILEGQLVLQEENLHKRKTQLYEIVRNTETYEKQREIIEIIHFLQEIIVDLKNSYVANDIKHVLGNFEEILNSECDTLILKNIKPLANQVEYDKFISNLQLCLSAMKKISHSGRNFDTVHTLAVQIRNFMKVRDEINKLHQDVSQLEDDAVYTFLKNVSDFFAVKYNTEFSNFNL